MDLTKGNKLPGTSCLPRRGVVPRDRGKRADKTYSAQACACGSAAAFLCFSPTLRIDTHRLNRRLARKVACLEQGDVSVSPEAVYLYYIDENPIGWVDPEGLERKKGKTVNGSWPPLLPNLGGNKSKWNSKGYWECRRGGNLPGMTAPQEPESIGETDRRGSLG